AVGPPMASLLAAHSAQVLCIIDPNAKSIQEAKKLNMMLEGLSGTEGGAVIYLEGKPESPKVQAYLKRMGPFDHVVAPDVGIAPRMVAEHKRPEHGSVYIGPPAAPLQWENYEEALREAHLTVFDSYQAATPFSQGRPDGRIYRL